MLPTKSFGHAHFTNSVSPLSVCFPYAFGDYSSPCSIVLIENEAYSTCKSLASLSVWHIHHVTEAFAFCLKLRWVVFVCRCCPLPWHSFIQLMAINLSQNTVRPMVHSNNSTSSKGNGRGKQVATKLIKTNLHRTNCIDMTLMTPWWSSTSSRGPNKGESSSFREKSAEFCNCDVVRLDWGQVLATHTQTHTQPSLTHSLSLSLPLPRTR